MVILSFVQTKFSALFNTFFLKNTFTFSFDDFLYLLSSTKKPMFGVIVPSRWRNVVLKTKLVALLK